MRKNVRSMLFLICFGISFFNKAQAQLLSGTYTINSANPTDPGAGRNFQTFTAAALALANGVSGPVVIDVVPGSGPYNDQMTLDSVPGTSAANTVTFNCNGNELFFRTENGTNRAGIKLVGADYIIIDSLFIHVLSETALEFGYGVHILNNADNNIIRKCKIQCPLYTEVNQNTYGILINGDHDANQQGISYCDNNIITGNTIIGGWDAVMLNSVLYEEPYQLMNNNQITNNIIRDVQSHGIDLTFTSGTLVEGNDISGRVTDMFGTAINLGDANEKCIIRSNRIHDTHDDAANTNGPVGYEGISLTFSPAQPGRENMIINNLMYNWRNTGEQKGIVLWDASNVYIYHNTISLENNNPAGEGDTYGFATRSTCEHIRFLNNIITIHRAGNVNNRGISLETVRNFVSDRNDILIGTSGASNEFGRMGSTYADLAAWQLGTGLDFQSVSLDPKYTDLANGNLIPTDSAIDNMGSYVNVNNDIAGAARNNTHPDIGAYEFLTPPCTAPIEGGEVKFLPAGTLCESADLALNLVNNTFGSSQTYTWQTSSTENGTFSNISNALAHPAFDYQPASTLYYRAAITCGSITVYSDTVQVITSPRLAAGTYTIDAGQATGGTNFQSFNDALLAMSCGIHGPIIFNVVANSGPYNEQVIINNIPGTSATNTITFNGNGNTVSFLSTNTNERAVIKLNNAKYITLDSLQITPLGAASGEYGYGVQLFNDADNNTIKRCTVINNITSTSNVFAGIVINPRKNDAVNISEASYCDSNTIMGNTVIGGNYGITCTSDDGNRSAYGNSITNNTVKDFRQYGMYLAGQVDMLVEGNDISRPTRTVVSDFNGIYFTRGNQSISISKNKVHNPFDGNTNSTSTANGIYITSSDAAAATPVIVSNNLVYNFNGRGIQNGLYCNNSDNVKFYHNTVSLEDSTGVDITRTARALYIQSTVAGVEVKNNSLVINRNGTGGRYGMQLTSDETMLDSDHNNFFIKPDPANTSMYIVSAFNETFETLDAWKADTSLDVHSISMYPVYKDAANADFTPDILAFDNKGSFVDIATDINNKTRSNTTPDIGAIEFTWCTSFPVVTVASDSVTICSGQPVTFTVSNPEAGTTYNWFDAATGGTEVHSGNTYTVNSLTAPVEYWIEGITTLGCRSINRTQVEAVDLAPLDEAPVLRIDSVGTRAIRFEWNAVPRATGYQVSRDGVNFTNPSSGATGLTHTITGLNPEDTASLVVKALGTIECQSKLSARVQGATLDNPYFIPNTFTPNGNGKNDVFRITGVAVQSLRLMIFNQWGEKVFETTTPQQGWDGTYKGKQQPIGVYVYVARIVLTDGTVDNVKGTFNLVR